MKRRTKQVTTDIPVNGDFEGWLKKVASRPAILDPHEVKTPRHQLRQRASIPYRGDLHSWLSYILIEESGGKRREELEKAERAYELVKGYILRHAIGRQK